MPTPTSPTPPLADRLQQLRDEYGRHWHIDTRNATENGAHGAETRRIWTARLLEPHPCVPDLAVYHPTVLQAALADQRELQRLRQEHGHTWEIGCHRPQRGRPRWFWARRWNPGTWTPDTVGYNAISQPDLPAFEAALRDQPTETGRARFPSP
ncbi:hypothetical protein [Nocardiopsis baichengensis]|uniref:hypothetical protein n=1 Tax=Nocardiopsis baichengensis TaxID=280240 RepID=UPI00034DE115|nr:hypothetical protein [Nocardiopsis baichengensis]